ncbi:hypothetical protein EB796_005748 [Bugula neritina]|uniref:Uncharacterized protein n=1 Tax=Bugula neritina TaxID=10212 RepID=A0A7J7KDD1_BUGNE|nr:hypothetical protein EB796_005748 [Bugula neritina]
MLIIAACFKDINARRAFDCFAISTHECNSAGRRRVCMTRRDCGDTSPNTDVCAPEARPPLGFTDFTATDQDPVCGFFRSSPAVFDIEDNLLRSSVIRASSIVSSTTCTGTSTACGLNLVV